VDLTAEQARVVGCLIEKAETTPDSYPLTTNALRSACNQSTNRDPVVDYGEHQLDALMIELRELKLARTVTGSGHRVGKHKHVVEEALGLDGHELAVLASLLLRGPQTLNEIVTRTERYTTGPAGDRDAVDAAIDRLTQGEEPLVARLERQSGEREPRIDQRWAASATPTATTLAAEPSAEPELRREPDPTAEPATAAAVSDSDAELSHRVDALESALAETHQQLSELRRDLGY
jgi:uncharacterized protein YceH (UPF0502 family)